MVKKGGVQVVHKAATSSSDYKTNIGPFTALIVHHEISGGSGRVEVSMAPEQDGTYIAHHGYGIDLPATDKSTSYSCVFLGLMNWVNVKLVRTSGTHTVTIQPLMQ